MCIRAASHVVDEGLRQLTFVARSTDNLDIASFFTWFTRNVPDSTGIQESSCTSQRGVIA